MFNLHVFDYQLQYKEAEGSSHRDGSYTETPSTPKVSADLLSFHHGATHAILSFKV